MFQIINDTFDMEADDDKSKAVEPFEIEYFLHEGSGGFAFLTVI